MRIEVDTQLGGTLNHVFAVDAASECFVFHLLSNAGDFYVGDCLCGLHESARGEKAGQFIAGEERLV